MLLVILCYLIGSISFSILIGKLRGVDDIRLHGSGNAGATNTFRVLGMKWGILVLLLDMAKAVIPLKLIELFFLTPQSPWLIPLIIALILGHLLPIFHGWKGGKGVAVLAGSIVALFPLLGLVAFLIIVPLIIITRVVSLAVFIVAFLLPIGYIVLYPSRDIWYIVFFILIGAMLVWTHRKNIKRIIRGEENKLTFRRK